MTQPRHRTSNVMSKRHLLVVAVSGLMLACAACSSRPLQGMLTPVAADVDGTSRVSVLAATTRQRSANDAGEMFSGERADNVSYASIVVSIPPDAARKVGAVQWPASLPGDPSRSLPPLFCAR